jgi:hypothetical protein
MTRNTNLHITLSFNTYNLNGTEVKTTNCYAVSDKTLASARTWLKQQKHPTACSLNDWLRKHSAKLDRRDGPATIERYPSGNGRDIYYRNGKIHRDNGPAFVTRADCLTNEEYYRDGRHHREDGPAVITRLPGGVVHEHYCREGEFHRDDGPACVVREADGSVREQSFYLRGKRVSEWRVPEYKIIKGVTAKCALPKRCP